VPSPEFTLVVPWKKSVGEVAGMPLAEGITVSPERRAMPVATVQIESRP